jgi:transposase-like protein
MLSVFEYTPRIPQCVSINIHYDNVILTFIMYTCQSCRKTLSRKDSLLRHRRHFCKAIIPRKVTPNHSRDIHKKVSKSKISSDHSSVKLIQIVTGMLHEHQCRWRKDFKKLKNVLLKTKKYDSSADEEQNSTGNDEHKSTDDEEEHNSSTDDEANSSSE